MNKAVSYDFYVNVFLGCAIPEEDFARLCVRAEEFVRGAVGKRWALVPEEARQRAVCAVAEIVQDEERAARSAFREDNAVRQETVGDYSVSYRTDGVSKETAAFLDRRKREALRNSLVGVPALDALFHVRSFPCSHHIL